MKTMVLLLSSFIIMMLLGTVYAWSVFRVEVEFVYGTTALQSGLPYMTSLFFYAFSMMLTGRFLTVKNARTVMLSGVMLVSLGWYMASRSYDLLSLTLSYGVLIGVGVGMAYGVPVFIVNQRYQKSGLYTGIILSGFGASPLVTAPLVHHLISLYGLSQTFFLLGALSILILVPLTFVLSVKDIQLKRIETSDTVAFSSKKFFMLYLLFLIATTIGLMMIGLSYRIGVLNYGFNVRHVALSLSFFAVLNGISRPLFGWIVDRKGFVYSATLSSFLILFGSLLALINQGNNLVVFIISMGLFWFNLGAWLSMLPISIKCYFGTYLYAKRYGLMFTSYGFGAIVGTLLSGLILDIFVETWVLYTIVFAIVLIILWLVVKLRRFDFKLKDQL